MAATRAQALSLALHSLGYPEYVPRDLLQAPNFEFVADCFAWLCHRIDPEVVTTRDYGTEQKRVSFLTTLGSLLYAKTRIQVDLKRLYRAGGSAAKELLALATALQEAAQPSSSGDPEGGSAFPGMTQLQQSRVQDKATVQQLAQGTATSGQQLISSLSHAPAITQQLDSALSAGSDVATLKAHVRAAMAKAQKQVAVLQQAIAELDREQQSLEAKVEKRHTELDRMERRLDALHSIKPAQSEEVDRLEAELAELYRAYLHKFRNLEYLEGQLDRYNAVQEAKAKEADKSMRKIQRQMREEEARVLQGDQNGDPNHGGWLASSEDSEADFAAFEPKALPRLGAGLAAGHGAMSDHLLLVPDDTSSSNQSPARVGSGRISGGQSMTGSLRPSSAGSRRPSSVARRAGIGGAADMLVLDDQLQRTGFEDRGNGLPMRADNDF